jgi:hypothetical protein
VRWFPLVGYLMPFVQLMGFELYAVFARDPERFPPITYLATKYMPESVLMAVTVGLGTWLVVHWRKTYEWWTALKKKRPS